MSATIAGGAHTTYTPSRPSVCSRLHIFRGGRGIQASVSPSVCGVVSLVFSLCAIGIMPHRVFVRSLLRRITRVISHLFESGSLLGSCCIQRAKNRGHSPRRIPHLHRQPNSLALWPARTTSSSTSCFAINRSGLVIAGLLSLPALPVLVFSPSLALMPRLASSAQRLWNPLLPPCSLLLQITNYSSYYLLARPASSFSSGTNPPNLPIYPSSASPLWTLVRLSSYTGRHHHHPIHHPFISTTIIPIPAQYPTNESPIASSAPALSFFSFSVHFPIFICLPPLRYLPLTTRRIFHPFFH